MKLVDYGSDSEEEEDEDVSQEQPHHKPSIPLLKEAPLAPVATASQQPLQDEGHPSTKKRTIKYSDLPRFLNPAIHKNEKKDVWAPKSLAEIETERKRRASDRSGLDNANKTDEAGGKIIKAMRLPSPKHTITNEATESNLSKQRENKAIAEIGFNPESLFGDNIDESLIEEHDQDDLFISKKHKQIQEEDHEGARETDRKFAKNRVVNEFEASFLGQGADGKQIKVSEVSRDQIIGDSNSWLLNHQKQQQQSILRSGYHLTEQLDKSAKQKNHLNFLASEAIANSDQLDQQRAEQIRNTRIKRERYGW